MNLNIKPILDAIRTTFKKTGQATAHAGEKLMTTGVAEVSKYQRSLLIFGLMGLSGYTLYQHPPVKNLRSDEIAIRYNHLSDSHRLVSGGSLIVMPWIHELRVFSTRDQVYQPQEMQRADGKSPLQSVEGLSMGLDLTVRYAIDTSRLSAIARKLPDDISQGIVAPAVQGRIYQLFSRYTVREIFSTKRQEIQSQFEAELRPQLLAEGIVLKSVQIGQIDLPADYKRGLDGLLAQELESEKMRFTLEIKDKMVQQTALEAEAQKVKREKDAQAAANEQIIAAKAQEDAMKHVLPFKQRQIEQRQLEAEAEKISRIRMAEGSAQARQIEAEGEAKARRKLSDAEVYRIDQLGKVNAEQLEREGALITKHPLLIQKALADKLSDKVQVIIAAPPSDGSFIGSNLIGGIAQHSNARSAMASSNTASSNADTATEE